MFRVLRALIAVLTLGLVPAWSQRPMRVAFVSPNEGTELFWKDVADVMKAAAKDLGIQLDQHVATRWPGGRAALVKEIVSGPNRPDYLILTIHMGVRTSELEIAEAARVPVFVINAGLLEEDAQRVGGPRKHFKYWIGQMIPNEEQAGYDLGTLLLKAGRERFGEAPLGVLALGGRETDLPALERNKGLRRAVAEQKGASLLQLVTANYERAQGREKLPLMLKRYPQANLLWGANDPMALGAIAGLEGSGRSAGKELLFGGMDWDPQALEAIRKHEMVGSMGGHFFEAAWAMVLLYDHHHGIDFAKERVDWRSRMYALTASNLGTFMGAFGDRNWSKIRFKAFSKKYHPELTRYAFGVEALLEQQRGASKP